MQAFDTCMTPWNRCLQVYDKFSKRGILNRFIEDFLCQRFIALLDNFEGTHQDATMPRLIPCELQSFDKLPPNGLKVTTRRCHASAKFNQVTVSSREEFLR